MPLTIDMTKCNIPAQQQLLQTYAFASMIIGVSDITKANYKKWYLRFKLADSLNGPFFPGTTITLQDVKDRIGTKTNSSDLSSTQFLLKMQRIHDERVNREEKLKEEVQ